MKIAYSQFRNPEWGKMIAAFGRHSEAEMAKEYVLRLRALTNKSSLTEEAILNIACDMFVPFVFIAEKFHRCQHYFVAPGVADFCINSVKCCSEEYYRTFPDVAPIYFCNDKNSFRFPGGMFFHFPANEHRRSFYLSPSWATPVTDTIAVKVRAAMAWANCEYYWFGQDQLCQEGEASEKIKLILGLSLYMDAFPDTVVPAADHSVHHLRHYKGEQRQIGRAPAMEHEERCAVRPHFRRGHFRVLQSAKFVHKRGQTIFVAGTFVRGTAFDVLDDAPKHQEVIS